MIALKLHLLVLVIYLACLELVLIALAAKLASGNLLLMIALGGALVFLALFLIALLTWSVRWECWCG